MPAIKEFLARQAYGFDEEAEVNDIPPAAITADRLANSFAYRQGLRRGIELAKMRYPDYLKTREWRDTRQHAIEAANGSCQRCGSGQRLDVHHLSYDHRGFEELDELAVLCNPCHRLQHDGWRD